MYKQCTHCDKWVLFATVPFFSEWIVQQPNVNFLAMGSGVVLFYFLRQTIFVRHFKVNKGLNREKISLTLPILQTQHPRSWDPEGNDNCRQLYLLDQWPILPKSKDKIPYLNPLT